MIEIIKELKIEVSKPNIFQAVVAKQYDMNTRFIKATFVDGTDIIYIPHDSTVKAIINAERPDGQSKGFDGVVNEDGTVTVPLHSWMLEMEGTVICDISIIDTDADDSKKLTTTAFTLLVERAAYGGGDVTNDPQYDVLISLLETCQEASIVAQEALDKSNEANSKYDACVEATAYANEAADNANAVREEIEAGGYIESLKELNNGGKFSVWVGTQEEYDAIENKDSSRLYIISDEPTNYIVEEFQEGIWTCRKWSNGYVECWGNASYTAENTTAKPNIPNGGEVRIDLEYPSSFDFVAVPISYSHPIMGAYKIRKAYTTETRATGWSETNPVYKDSKKYVTVYARFEDNEGLYADPDVDSIQTIIIHVIAKGRWK